MHYRMALPKDLNDIVSLHVEGGQQAYSHILSKDYLTNTMPSEKAKLWQDRLGHEIDASALSVTVAEAGGELAGFACFLLDQETDFGTYLHNIYVSNRHQRQGVASGLLVSGIANFSDTRKMLPVHLLVFAENTPARAFYDRMGGGVVERIEKARRGSEPVELVRYQWSSATKLSQAALPRLG